MAANFITAVRLFLRSFLWKEGLRRAQWKADEHGTGVSLRSAIVIYLGNIEASKSKVVVTELSSSHAANGNKSASVTEKGVRSADTGQFHTVRTLDGGSKIFGKDLTYVFTRNVAKARRDNKKVRACLCAKRNSDG